MLRELLELDVVMANLTFLTVVHWECNVNDHLAATAINERMFLIYRYICWYCMCTGTLLWINYVLDINTLVFI